MGVVGLPSVAEALRRHGFTVIASADADESARSIATYLRECGRLPVISAATPWPGMQAWLNWVAELTPTTVVAGSDQIDPSRLAALQVVAAPVLLSELCAFAGLGLPADTGAGVIVDAGYEVTTHLPATTVISASGPAAPVLILPTSAGPLPTSPVASEPVPTHAPTPSALRTNADPTQAAPSTEQHASRISDLLAPTSQPLPRQQTAKVIVSVAGKGGVGKTSCAIGIAARAAARGLRVLLLDANLGQGDIRTFLRLANDRPLPSVHTYATTGSVRDAIIKPSDLNDLRSPGSEHLGFALILAAPPTVPLHEVTPEVHLELVRTCAASGIDLIVIDTQIIEPRLVPEPIVGRFIDPLMAAGAYSLGLADLSGPGIANLLTRFSRAAEQGVASDHQFALLNRVPGDLAFNRQGVESAFSGVSTYLGAIPADTAIAATTNGGGTASALLSQPFDTVLDAIFSRSPQAVSR